MNLTKEARFAINLIEKKKFRDEKGLFVLEGEKLVREGIDRLASIFYSEKLPIVEEIREKKIQSYKISKELMQRVTSLQTPPIILGIAKKPAWKLESLLKIENLRLLVGIEIQDPGNLGTMIRSADASGTTGIILSKGTVDPYNPKVVRSTMGSIFRVPIIEVDDLHELLKELKSKGIRVIGSSLTAGKSHWNVDLTGKIAMLIGNEGSGISNEVLSLCDLLVKIPIFGKAESLNAAMASAILLYEAARQRMKSV